MREPRFDVIKGGYDTHLVLSHYIANKQYDASNAWNVNNDGNVNNDDKYNGNYAVPVADYGNIKDAELSFASFIEAYYNCLKHKRSTDNAVRFYVDGLRECLKLWREVQSGKYKIGRSICFIVDRPVKREVFAASFRDRIIHHWIAIRMEPLFEDYLFDCMKSNRKKKGTGDAIKDVYDNIKIVSENYTGDAWIYKFDLKGFFMSIDKTLLTKKLTEFIEDKYNERDKELLKKTVQQVVLHCPQKNCVRKCSKTKWVGLAPNKSLFNQDDNHGIAIGNLTSQMFANFLLYDAVKFCKDNGFTFVTEYVDDFVIIHKSKEEILAFIPRLRTFLKDKLGITLHPKKSYIQHYTKGVAFVGGIIKPYRMYLSKRSVKRCSAKIWWVCHSKMRDNDFLASVNSYLGLSQHFAAYRLRQWVMYTLFSYRKDIYFTNNIYSMKLYNK